MNGSSAEPLTKRLRPKGNFARAQNCLLAKEQRKITKESGCRFLFEKFSFMIK
jgi:hypothetical protein